MGLSRFQDGLLLVDWAKLEELRELTVYSVSDLDLDWSVKGNWVVALCLSVLKKRLLPQFHRILSIVLPPFFPSVDSNVIFLPIIFIRMTAGVQCDFALFYPSIKPDFLSTNVYFENGQNIEDAFEVDVVRVQKVVFSHNDWHPNDWQPSSPPPVILDLGKTR